MRTDRSRPPTRIRSLEDGYGPLRPCLLDAIREVHTGDAGADDCEVDAVFVHGFGLYRTDLGSPASARYVFSIASLLGLVR
jgi:hypothetical protein